MFFQDLFFSPAFGPVKFGDQWLGILQTYLVDSIFITVKGKYASITQITEGFNGIDDEVRGQDFKRMWIINND